MGGRKQKTRELNSGICIIGEGITEHYYFYHLKNILKIKCQIKPRLFCNTSISDIGKTIIRLLKERLIIICVFDADVSKYNTKERERLEALKSKYKDNKNVIICDSYPAIEYWFLIHYKDTCPNCTSKQMENLLKKDIPDYDKKETFLKKEKWVRDMLPKLSTAMKKAEKDRLMNAGSAPYSNIDKAIEKLNIMNEKITF